MKTKKLFFVISIVVLLMAILSIEELRFCNFFSGQKCPIELTDKTEGLIFTFFITISIFSFITYRMKEPVFQRWFKFAVWYVPLLIVGYFLFPTSISGGLGIASGITEGFNTIILIILFSIFIITSIVKIVRAYKESK